jgi:hypothetical protein
MLSSKELLANEKDINVFIEIVIIKKQSKQSKEKVFSQTSHEGLIPPKLLTSINYGKGTF